MPALQQKLRKTPPRIEKYLRSLGDVNFAGAMEEQMKTMSGVLSNIEDGFEKMYRDIGKNGLNDALKTRLRSLMNWWKKR